MSSFVPQSVMDEVVAAQEKKHHRKSDYTAEEIKRADEGLQALEDDDDQSMYTPFFVRPVVLPVEPVHAPLPVLKKKETKKELSAREKVEKKAADDANLKKIYRPIMQWCVPRVIPAVIPAVAVVVPEVPVATPPKDDWWSSCC